MGTEVIQCLFPAPRVPSSLTQTQAQGWGGATFVCVCHRVEMGCSASRAEDDSLGYWPGTLGKARPASGQSPRELRGREEGAGPV